ncbi:MAG TPA: hypothetical protein VGK32_16690 [Vicinamibacterales bacterium]
MSSTPGGPSLPSGTPADEVPQYRPRERYWPYVDVPEEPTDEEVAALDPALRQELFGVEQTEFSVTVVFPRFDGPVYGQAVELARKSFDYRETGTGERFRHRARYRPGDVTGLRALWNVVGDLDAAEVLVDDRPVPYARELWLPLFWFLLMR